MLVVCAGTATDVGKTWVGAATLTEIRRRGRTVSARKPAQSYDPRWPSDQDGAVLAGATGERSEDVCPTRRTYALPMAPPMAAAALGEPVPTVAELESELGWATPLADLRWVELVGGPRSPVAVDADGVDFTARLGPDRVVLVAEAGLGAINAVTLCLGPFVELGHRPIVMLNRYNPGLELHRRNRSWLTERCGSSVLAGVDELADALC